MCVQNTMSLKMYEPHIRVILAQFIERFSVILNHTVLIILSSEIEHAESKSSWESNAD